MVVGRWYGDGAGNTVEEKLYRLLPNPNELVAVSKGTQAVKLLQHNPLVLNWGFG